MYKVFWILQRSLKCLDLHTTNLGLLYNSVFSYLCTLYKCGRHLMTHEVLYCLAATSANWHCVLYRGKVSTDDSLRLVQMYVRLYEAVHSLLLIPRVASPMSSRFCAVPSLTESTSWSCPHLTKIYSFEVFNVAFTLYLDQWLPNLVCLLSPPHSHSSQHTRTCVPPPSHHIPFPFSSYHTHHHPFSSHTPFHMCTHSEEPPQ